MDVLEFKCQYYHNHFFKRATVIVFAYIRSIIMIIDTKPSPGVCHTVENQQEKFRMSK